MPSRTSGRLALRAWWRLAAAMLVAPATRRAPMAGSEYGHDVRSGAGADLGSVFVVGDVANPVDLVFDRPVSADPVGELPWFRLACLEVGDRVDGFAGEACRLVEMAAPAADLHCLGQRRGTRCRSRRTGVSGCGSRGGRGSHRGHRRGAHHQPSRGAVRAVSAGSYGSSESVRACRPEPPDACRRPALRGPS
jgi:hypothetical protein